jgi:DHA1 family multidrug resistance protein-like MFS transporter
VARIFKLAFPFGVLNRDLKLILACNLVGSFGDGLYAYLLPVYITGTLKASSVEVGILYAVLSLSTALTLLLAGTLADRYDRKKIMIAGWLAWIPAPLIFSLASNWLQMLPGMILWGVWLGGPTTTAYIVGTADKSKLTLTFTAISSGWSFGYIFSPGLGGYIAGTFGPRVIFYLGSILYASACFILMFISKQKSMGSKQSVSQERNSFFQLLRTRRLLKLSIFFASVWFVLMLYRPFVPQFLADKYGYGDFEIGVLGSVLFFGSAVLGILLGRLGDKWKKSYALATSLALSSISLVLLLLVNNFSIMVIAFFVAGGSLMIWSLMSAIIGPIAPESIRARWVSIPQSITVFSSFLAPYVGGILYSVSPSYPFIIGIALTLFIALLATTKILEE